MPELPEVEVVRLQLLHKVVGKTIAAVDVFHDKSTGHDPDFETSLKSKTISGIERVGKLLIFSFADEPNLFLLVHLKMTGQLIYRDDTGTMSGGGHTLSETDTTTLPGRHTRTAFHFTDKSVLYFNDMRLFGYTKLADATTTELARAGFGPEPIDPEFDCAWFTAAVRKRKAPIKAVLLDQSFVAGLGNIYVDEALFEAQILPTRRADTLTEKEVAALCAAAGTVMRASIQAGGTTFRNFLDTGGKNGNFTDYLRVFGKQNTACPRCDNLLLKMRVAGRGTHYCAACQY